MSVASEGFDVPALDDRPVLHPVLGELWDAFNVLSASRPVGMCVGYIPLAEIVCYATVIGYERVADFIHIMRSLDTVFVKHQNERADDGRGKTPTDD